MDGRLSLLIINENEKKETEIMWFKGESTFFLEEIVESLVAGSNGEKG